MTTITIPKEFSRKGDLVVIPRQEYDKLLKKQRIIPIVRLTVSEKKALDRARREMAKGEFITLETLEHDLANTYSKKRGKKS